MGKVVVKYRRKNFQMTCKVWKIVSYADFIFIFLTDAKLDVINKY